MNLSKYIQQKIYNHCFTNNIPNLYDEINVSDLICYHNKEELKEAIDNQVKNIFNDYPVHYDKPMITIIDLYYKLKIEPSISLFKQYVSVLLEKEKLYPFDAISISLMIILTWMIKNKYYDSEFWLNLIDNGNSNLYHLYVCGLFKLKGFNQELYNDLIKNCHSIIVVNTMLECQALTIDELTVAYRNLPANLKEKIKIDSSNTTNKNIVLN